MGSACFPLPVGGRGSLLRSASLSLTGGRLSIMLARTPPSVNKGGGAHISTYIYLYVFSQTSFFGYITTKNADF